MLFLSACNCESVAADLLTIDLALGSFSWEMRCLVVAWEFIFRFELFTQTVTVNWAFHFH